MTDPVADFLTRVRNAIQANHRIVEIPGSNMKREMTKILHEKGIKIISMGENKWRIVTHLDYTNTMHDLLLDTLMSI